MKYFMKYLGYYVISLILLIFICSLLNLAGVNSTITNLILFIFNATLFFVFGLKSGKNANNKGFLEGLKIGGLFLLVLIIISLFTNKTIFSLSTFIYYLVLMLASIAGGSIGINKKDSQK